MRKRNEEIRSTSDLRKMLIGTIGEVRSGKIDVKQARTIAAISTTILQSAKLDLDMMKFAATEGSIAGRKATLALVSE